MAELASGPAGVLKLSDDSAAYLGVVARHG
jgi:hypothetical protein